MIYKLLFVLGMMFILTACEKSEGEGGTSTIEGSVTVEEWDEDMVAKRSEHPAYAEDVYIIYGSDDFYGDKVETHSDGTYKFEYLRKGTYTIYIYSIDTLNPSNMVVVSQTVDITDNKQTVQAPELVIVNDNGDDGIYTVSGKVILEQYSANFEAKRTEYAAQEIDIYIQRENEDFYFDRVKTDSEGHFEFSNLITGNYIVYTYSKSPELSADEKEVVEKTIAIVESGESTDFTTEDFIIKDNEGDDGIYTISGKVILEQFSNNFEAKRTEYPAQEIDVYIQRENEAFYFDRVKTDSEGYFEFPSLIAGDYIVYTYSESPELSADEKEIVEKAITITEGGESTIFATEDMVIMDNEGDEGNCTVKGVIIMEEWNGTFTLMRDMYPAHEENVYIMKAEDDFYLSRIDTDYKGQYVFNNLSTGKYYIYSYSKDPSVNYDISNKMIAVMDSVEILNEGATAVVDTIRIKN